MTANPMTGKELAKRLTPLGPVAARRMFGGEGLFLDDVMFALIASGVPYFKADDDNRGTYEAAGGEPFSYQRGGKTHSLGYWTIPGADLEDPERLVEWAESAHAAALRAKHRKGGRSRAKRRSASV